MLADLTPLQKLYNKGVDITAGVITSTLSAGIIAVIATLTWRWKRKRDLKHEEDKQRQHDRISVELEAERADTDRRAWRQKLPMEREDHAVAAEGAASYPQLVRCWVNYVVWLRSKRLSELPGNLRVLNQHGEDGRHIMSVATSEGLPGIARSTADTIRNTELPPDS